MNEKFLFLSGDEALAHGAYEAGLSFASSYPGTPASEILEYCARFVEVDAQWSVNEKIAYEVALASSIGGLRALYASKHVGINVAMDPLMTSVYTGVNAGFIVVTGDDPGIHSSQNEQDNRLLAAAAKMPLLEPSSPREAFQYAKEAFSLSETFDTPVMVRLTTRVAHTKENISAGKRVESPVRQFIPDPAKYVMVPRNAYRRHLELEKRLVRLSLHSEQSALNSMELNDTRIGFVASGAAYLYAKEAYPEASFLKLGMPYPFPAQKAREFASKVKKVFVIEELEPFLEEQLKIAGISSEGKHRSWRVGELRPESIPLIVNGREKTEEEYTARKPVMCPGCPHRPVFHVLKKLKAVVTGDIGCYTLGALPPLAALHTCLCMGAGITFFEGLRKSLGKKVVGVIGDSTFVHSGIPGLVNAAYNKAKGLIIILDNSTTAMTGSQPHPATGVTAKGEQTKKLILEEVCASCGADNVDVVHPFDVKELEALVRSRMEEDALSVLIARSPCKLIDRSRSPAPDYEKEKCKKCSLCLNINCPAVLKRADGSIEIQTAYCAGCNLCVQVCPARALTKAK